MIILINDLSSIEAQIATVNEINLRDNFLERNLMKWKNICKKLKRRILELKSKITELEIEIENPIKKSYILIH
jgi:hypothetical protein